MKGSKSRHINPVTTSESNVADRGSTCGGKSVFVVNVGQGNDLMNRCPQRLCFMLIHVFINALAPALIPLPAANSVLTLIPTFVSIYISLVVLMTGFLAQPGYKCRWTRTMSKYFKLGMATSFCLLSRCKMYCQRVIKLY